MSRPVETGVGPVRGAIKDVPIGVESCELPPSRSRAVTTLRYWSRLTNWCAVAPDTPSLPSTVMMTVRPTPSANHGACVRLDHVGIRGNYWRHHAVIEENRVPPMLSHPAVEVVVNVTVSPTCSVASDEPAGAEIKTCPALTFTGSTVCATKSSSAVVLIVVGLVVPST